MFRKWREKRDQQQKERERTREREFPTRSDWFRKSLVFLYLFLIGFIIFSAFYRVFHISEDKNVQQKQTTTASESITKEEKKNQGIKDSSIKSKEDLKTTETSADVKKSSKAEKPKTITEELIIPMLKSQKVRIILESLFYGFLVFICMILIPLPLERMKRFKLFNFELEMDSEQKDITRSLSIQQDKFKFLNNRLKEENKEVFMIKEREHRTFKDMLTEILGDMRTHYSHFWEINFGFDVMTKEEFDKNITLPKKVKKSLQAAKDFSSGLPINKETESLVHLRSFLIHYHKTNENSYTRSQLEVEYVIILYSYNTLFDEYDGQLVSGLCSLASELHKRTHLLGAYVELQKGYQKELSENKRQGSKRKANNRKRNKG